jgi:hypothetical protein
MLYFKNKLARKEDNIQCYLCKSALELNIGYKYTNILKCSNKNCKSNLEKGFKFKRKAFYDEECLKKMGNSESWKKSPISLEYWLNKGLSEHDAVKSLHEYNSKNSKKAKKANSWDLKYLIDAGYTDEDALLMIKKRKEKTYLRKDFWIKKGYSEEDAIKKISLIQQENSRKASLVIDKRIHPTNIKYWINKGYSEEEAKDVMENFCKKNYSVNKETFVNYDEMINKRKLTWSKKTIEEKTKINKTRGRSLEQLIETFGKEKAYKIIKDRCNSFKEKNWSKISKELFTKIEHYLGKPCFYAENEKQFIFSNKIYYADFFDGNTFIIEFHGDIFHANPKIFTEHETPNPFSDLTSKEIWEKDLNRKNYFESNGYKIYWVWENEYLENKKNTIEKIINFYEKNYKVN